MTTACIGFSILFQAEAGFRTNQSADAVIGQPDFTTSGGTDINATRLGECSAAAVDPTTGKIFVVDGGASRVLRFPSPLAMVNAQAEAVIGQPNLTSLGMNNGGISAKSLNQPLDLWVDNAGTLWVADTGNCRILAWFHASSLENWPAADLVIGQPDFTSRSAALTRNRLSLPSSIMVDASGRLWVADSFNSRVLRFDRAADSDNGVNADAVLGAPDFTTSSSITPTATSMNYPIALGLDPQGRLWVADRDNDRVLRFDNAALKNNGAPADIVLGQPDFETNAQPSIATQKNFRVLSGLAVDAKGNVWVSDSAFRRVLRFSASGNLQTNAAADLVLGQPDFTTVQASGASASVFGDRIQEVHFSPDGRLFVSDSKNRRVLRFTPAPEPEIRPSVRLRAARKIQTRKQTFVIRGTAKNAVRVEVKTGRSAFRPARGHTKWSYVAHLRKGGNPIAIRAVSSTGTRSRTIRLTVTRISHS